MVRLLAVTVLLHRFFALSITSLETSAPFSAISVSLSASSFMVPTFSLIFTVVAAVSCIPAASCWLVAELSEHMWSTVSVTCFNPSTFPVICWLAVSIFATISRRFLLIARSSRAIKPVSSVLLHKPSLFALWLKFRSAVFLIISVRCSSGVQMKRLNRYPIITQTTSVIPAVILINQIIWLTGFTISSLSAVTTTIIWSGVSAYPAYLIPPLNSYSTTASSGTVPDASCDTTSLTTVFSTGCPILSAVGW